MWWEKLFICHKILFVHSIKVKNVISPEPNLSEMCLHCGLRSLASFPTQLRPGWRNKKSTTSNEHIFKNWNSKRREPRELRAERKRAAIDLHCAVNNAGYSSQDFHKTDYYFKDGMRHVYPYPAMFFVTAKKRWFDKPLFEVFRDEFWLDSDYLERSIQNGKININGCRVATDYILKEHDVILHQIHRHESPVIGKPIEIFEETKDLLIINKPSSVPVHSSGNYYFNTVLSILIKENGYRDILMAYRLDRLTSGLLFFGKNRNVARKMHQQAEKNEIHKHYVCRVLGKFPDGIVTVDQPLHAVYHKFRMQTISLLGKSSLTHFKRLSYNGKSSVVQCFPKTGRTHQIRVHLQYLGFPILNDFMYNHRAWGPNRGKGGDYTVPLDQVAETIGSEIVNLTDSGINPLYYKKFPGMDMDIDIPYRTIQRKIGLKSKSFIKPPSMVKSSAKDDCDFRLRLDQVSSTSDICRNVNSTEIDIDHNNVLNHRHQCVPDYDESRHFQSLERGCFGCKRLVADLPARYHIMFLHALKYKGPDWEYETPMPEWAHPDWSKEEEFIL